VCRGRVDMLTRKGETLVSTPAGHQQTLRLARGYGKGRPELPTPIERADVPPKGAA